MSGKLIKCHVCLQEHAPGLYHDRDGNLEPPHCAYCSAGLERTAETGGQTFIHVLTRGAGGQILKWHPCTRSN